MKHLILFTLFGLSLSAVPVVTTIQDTLYRSNALATGGKFTGPLTVSNPAFVAGDGTQLPAGSITVSVVNGVLNIQLVPMDNGALCTGGTCTLVYTVKYGGPFGGPQTQYWLVTTSGSPLHLANIIVTNPGSSTFVISLSQLSTSGAVNPSCITFTTSVAWRTCPGGGGGVTVSATFLAGATSGTITHNFATKIHTLQCFTNVSGVEVVPANPTRGTNSDVPTFPTGLAADTVCFAMH